MTLAPEKQNDSPHRSLRNKPEDFREIAGEAYAKGSETHRQAALPKGEIAHVVPALKVASVEPQTKTISVKPNTEMVPDGVKQTDFPTRVGPVVSVGRQSTYKSDNLSPGTRLIGGEFQQDRYGYTLDHRSYRLLGGERANTTITRSGGLEITTKEDLDEKNRPSRLTNEFSHQQNRFLRSKAEVPEGSIETFFGPQVQGKDFAEKTITIFKGDVQIDEFEPDPSKLNGTIVRPGKRLANGHVII